MKDFSYLRREYEKSALQESEIKKNPMEQFEHWFQEAIEFERYDPNAMVLSTTNEMKKVTSRIVLMKSYSEKGFIFFGHYQSKKGRQLAQVSNAALNFYWPEQIRQIRVEGTVNKIAPEVSDKYFSSRPRNSQIAAHTSLQSNEIKDRETLESEYNKMVDKIKDHPIARPHDWGGWILTPKIIEFWQGRENRLHDRIEYFIANDIWSHRRLFP